MHPREESNLYLAFRKRPFYPLNYDGRGIKLKFLVCKLRLRIIATSLD